MPRTARASVGNMCYHVINRGNGRAEVFHKEDDYVAFLKLMSDANNRLPMRLLAYCLMPNHFHFVLWPREDGDLSLWMPRLDPGPVPRPQNWLARVNQPQTEGEIKALRESIARGRPFGSDRWRKRIAKTLGLESSLRPRGRPRKKP